MTNYLLDRAEQGLEPTEVREVRILLVGGIHRGEVIQFVAGGEVFELLVRPCQGVRIVEGHSDLLERKILSLKVGDQWDEKEKIFRNWMGAFDTSSVLVLQADFGSNLKNNFFTLLEFTLYNQDGDIAGSTFSLLASAVSLLAWSRGMILLPISQMQKNLTAGVWTVRVSTKRRTIGMLTFSILDKNKG